MHGAGTSFFLAEIAIPGAWQCFQIAAPFLALAALRWVLTHLDQTIDRVFPHWEWEKRLGWLNIQAERRANAVLRWIGYFCYAILALALYGIVWATPALGNLDRWNDPDVVAELSLRLPVLLICLGLWLVYLGFELIPKLRRYYESEELEKYRAEQAELEREREINKPSRFKSSLPKPRVDLPARSGRTGQRR